MKKFLNLIKKTFSEWSEDHAARLAAALAYYTTFSLAPLLVIIIAVAGLVGYREAAQSGVMAQVEDLAGAPGREFGESMLANASNRSTGIAATIISTVTLLFGALGVFGELQNALNTIWEVKPKPLKGLGGTLKRLIFQRILSFGMLIVIAFLLLVSLVVSAGLAAFGEYFGGLLPISDLILQVLNFVISFGVITLLFALIFKFMPDADIAWKDVWLGAAVTSLLFTLGKFAIGLYLGRSNVGTAFGAAGSLALLMIWIYYSAQIVFLGAEFTQVYANLYGSRVVPDEDAERIPEAERAEQGIPHEAPEGASQQSPRQTPQHRPGDVIPEAARLKDPRLGWYSPSLTQARSDGRKTGAVDKALYYVILAAQFIPSLRSVHASKTKRA